MMRRPRTLAAVCLLALAATARGDDATLGAQDAEALRRFRDAKLGVFAHWGLDALLAKGDRVMQDEALPAAEYEKLAGQFNPARFDASAWARAAKSAGARYLTVVAKHADGFCLFDTAGTRFDVVDSTPFARDPLKALAEACRREGVLLFVSYSLADWHHPDAGPGGDPARYRAYCEGQVRELCAGYGPLGGFRFEGRPAGDADPAGLARVVRELQPSALVLADDAAPGAEARQELLTVNGSRGHDARDRAFKPAASLIRALVAAAGRDANLSVVVAARADGTIGPESVDRLAEVGRWVERNGLGIQGTRGGPIPPGAWGVSTRASDGPTIYLHVLKADEPITLPRSMKAADVRALGRAGSLKLTVEGDGVNVELPADLPDAVDTVLVASPIGDGGPARPRR